MTAGEVLDGRYELLRQIGLGGMGSVWEARDRTSGRQVAVKALHEHLLDERALVARFLQEAQAALEARLSGHIIEVLDVVQPPERPPYQVMEYLEGEDLEQILEREGALEATRAVDLILQTCEALAEVHRQGLIHRDIKPENLFVTHLKDGREWIKLLDFGVVKFSSAAAGQGRALTDVGSTVGTPHYMAPEQATGLGKLDHRADLYATGCVLYELLTGKLPYEADDQREVMRMHARGKPPPLRRLRPELPKGLERVLLKAMAGSPSRRYSSMFELADALSPYGSRAAPREPSSAGGVIRSGRTVREALSTDVMETLTPEERRLTEQGERRQRLTRGLVIFAGAATLLSVTLAVVLFGLRGCQEPEPVAIEEQPQILLPDLAPDAAVFSPPPLEPPRATPDAAVDMAFSLDDVPAVVPDVADGGEPGDGGMTHEEWLERYGKRLDRRAVARSLGKISSKVRGCLRGTRAPGSKVSVHFWIVSDGRVDYRRSRPSLSAAAESCLRRVARSTRLGRTGVPPFVATQQYTVPGRR